MFPINLSACWAGPFLGPGVLLPLTLGQVRKQVKSFVVVVVDPHLRTFFPLNFFFGESEGKEVEEREGSGGDPTCNLGMCP